MAGVFKLRRGLRQKANALIVLTIFAMTIYYCVYVLEMTEVPLHSETQHVVYGSNQEEFKYDKKSPLIFIGGVPRSGTTLMRAILDAHPDVRCGEETRVIPNILGQSNKWMKNPIEKGRLLEAGINQRVIDDAVSAFILEVMAKHGEPAKRLCNKDPFVLMSISYLHGVFPNGRYLLMIRDGRATVHSIISRHVGIAGYNISSYRDCLMKWSMGIEAMLSQCLQEGPSVCLPVYYEKLVLNTEEWMRRILEFLDIPWDDAVLHHEDAVGKPGGISLSKVEKSTDQVIKPVNQGALTKWVGHIPKDVQADIDTIAPMLRLLGYDSSAMIPNYKLDMQPSVNEILELAAKHKREFNPEDLMNQHRNHPPQGHGMMPNHGQGGMPNFEQGGMPNFGQGGMPNFGQGGMPNHGHGGMPNHGQGGMPNFGDGGMPNFGDGGMPNFGEGGMPNFGQGGMPNFGEGGMPNFGDGGMPNFGDGGMPHFGEGGMPNFGQGGMPNFGEGGMPNFGEGGMPNFGQGGMPNFGQGDHGMPNFGQGGMPPPEMFLQGMGGNNPDFNPGDPHQQPRDRHPPQNLPPNNGEHFNPWDLQEQKRNHLPPMDHHGNLPDDNRRDKMPLPHGF